jgi:ubiquinone/menaquinone biosynthesis C-methylase UbiE
MLASPLRRMLSRQHPQKLMAPYVREGMTVLEPGPGMGFFSLELARRVGSTGRLVAVDIQPRMLSSWERRAARAQLQQQVQTRLATPESLGIADLAGGWTLPSLSPWYTSCRPP